MNKEAYTEKIRGIDRAIEWHDGELKAWQRVKTEAELTQAELAEAEKPELRHGDYGMRKTGHGHKRRLFSYTSGELKVTNAPADALPAWPGAANDYVILGNIFDNLKAVSEPLEGDQFTLQPFGAQENDGIWARITGPDFSVGIVRNGQKHSWCYDSKQFAKLILNLQRLQYTERQKNDNQD